MLVEKELESANRRFPAVPLRPRMTKIDLEESEERAAEKNANKYLEMAMEQLGAES